MYKKNYIRRLFLLFCLLTAGLNIQAQQIEPLVKLTKGSILIGDTLSMTVTVKAPEGTFVVLPQMKDTVIREIEILDVGKVDTLAGENQLVLRQDYLLIAFDSGFYQVPPIPVLYGDGGKDTAWTNGVLLAVNTMEVDTSKAVFDIKPPVDAPYTFREFIPYILWALLAVAIIAAVYFYLQKRKKKEKPAPPPKPAVPPHILALEKLEVLKSEKLWQKGNIKEYHSRVTEIIREYIENRFAIRALEQTSTEIMDSLRYSGLFSQNLLEKMQHILTIGDLAKFAKIIPGVDDNEKSLFFAFDFVNETKSGGKTEDARETGVKIF